MGSKSDAENHNGLKIRRKSTDYFQRQFEVADIWEMHNTGMDDSTAFFSICLSIFFLTTRKKSLIVMYIKIIYGRIIIFPLNKYLRVMKKLHGLDFLQSYREGLSYYWS